MPPRLTLEVSGGNVNASWPAVVGAGGYTLYYAPYPEGTPIGAVDMGSGRSLSVELPANSAFYVAVTAAGGDGERRLVAAVERTTRGATVAYDTDAVSDYRGVLLSY